MKKIMVGLLAVVLAVSYALAGEGTLGTNPSMPSAPTWKGTLVGDGFIANGTTGAIVIGNGLSNGLSQATANGAIQIGPGSNGVANTVQFNSDPVYAIERGTVAAIAGATVTGTFARVHTSSPISVSWRYTGTATNVATTVALILPTISSNNIIWAAVQTNLSYIAIW